MPLEDVARGGAGCAAMRNGSLEGCRDKKPWTTAHLWTWGRVFQQQRLGQYSTWEQHYLGVVALL